MEETYIVILIIAILILVLYFVNFSGKQTINNKSNGASCGKKYNTHDPTEKFDSCKLSQLPQITQITQAEQGNVTNKASLKVHIAHWCGWSKKLLQQLDSDTFKNAFKDVENICVLEIIDCEVNKEKCDPSIVKGFPTIILQTKSGVMKKYDGDRSTDDLIKFINANYS